MADSVSHRLIPIILWFKATDPGDILFSLLLISASMACIRTKDLFNSTSLFVVRLTD
jgi:hypothetical protein